MSSRSILPRPLQLIIAITLLYVFAWFDYYSQTPAGLYPNDAAQASLAAAQALAEGMPGVDSGHSLYTYILSLLARFSEDSASLTSAARGLNALALIISTIFCVSAAGRHWQSSSAIWLSGLLVGANPLLVFWAGEVSPTLLATACMSGALWCLLRWLRRQRDTDCLWISVSLTLAAAFETTLMPLALLWPAIAFFSASRQRIQHFIFALIPLLAGCGLFLVSSLQLQNPLQWNLDQFLPGIYSALGSPESPDVKSFSLYRQLHLLLFLNPIHWGALFILAGLGAYARKKEGHRMRNEVVGLCILVVFAISYALNESGNQARASLIPLLAIFAAGFTPILKIWKRGSRHTKRKIFYGTLAISLFSYAGYLGTPQSQKWEQDYIYLAAANIAFGANDQAITWAEKALELNPARSDMQQILVLAQFNDWAMGDNPRSLPLEANRELLQTARGIEKTPCTHTIEAIYLYKQREIEAANSIWQSQRADCALALVCLYWTGAITEITQSEADAYADKPYYELLNEVLMIERNALEYGKAEKQLDNMLAFTY